MAWLKRFLMPSRYRYQEETATFSDKMHDARQFGVERKRASQMRQRESRRLRESGLDYETLRTTLFDSRTKGGDA